MTMDALLQLLVANPIDRDLIHSPMGLDLQRDADVVLDVVFPVVSESTLQAPQYGCTASSATRTNRLPTMIRELLKARTPLLNLDFRLRSRTSCATAISC
jgi:hypothetical protein